MFRLEYLCLHNLHFKGIFAGQTANWCRREKYSGNKRNSFLCCILHGTLYISSLSSFCQYTIPAGFGEKQQRIAILTKHLFTQSRKAKFAEANKYFQTTVAKINLNRFLNRV
jgi:hypothetical protein